MDDVRNKRLRMIGNPAERDQEDPVRILRAARLSGKLGFEADEASARPISECAHLLRQEPVARLFDELLKILLSGHAEGCLKRRHKRPASALSPCAKPTNACGKTNLYQSALCLPPYFGTNSTAVGSKRSKAAKAPLPPWFNP